MDARQVFYIIMYWVKRVKPIKILRLYRYARLGIYDDMLLHDVGWQLYARCSDIVKVNTVFREGLVPCPQCNTKIARKIDPLFSQGEGGTRENWFHCVHCSKRLLWRDCRQALRNVPRCFTCFSILNISEDLACGCGKTWTQKSYNQSVRTRVRLPCPHCLHIVRRPEPLPATKSVQRRHSEPILQCPKCKETAEHISGKIQCTVCGYQRRWRDYRKSLKKKDEKLTCTDCGYSFKWQAWRKSTRTLRTGNPKPAREFEEKWTRCYTPQQRMIQIDSLLQTLHGRGPLAPLFIDSGEDCIRRMLDDLAK